MIREASRGRWRALLGASIVVTAGGAYLLVYGPNLGGDGSLQAALPAAVPSTQTAKRYQVKARPISPDVAFDSLHEWLVTVEALAGGPARGCRVAFDASMPEHGHGLPTSPQVTREDPPGVYLVEGVRFSMRGHWELNVTVAGCGPSETINLDLQI